MLVCGYSERICLENEEFSSALRIRERSYLANSTSDCVTDDSPSFLTSRTFRGGLGQASDNRSLCLVSL